MYLKNYYFTEYQHLKLVYYYKVYTVVGIVISFLINVQSKRK